MQYKKETKEVTVQEKERLYAEIGTLNDYTLDLSTSTEERHCKIIYNVELTMLDGKAINAITDTKSSQSCNVCGAKPSELNILLLIRKKKLMKSP